jgi:putative ABC transport system permease protein
MVWHDLRYGARTLVKRPGFTSAAVLTLALGIGANTAIFTVVEAVLLRPLPYPDADRLVRVRGLDLGTCQPGNLSPMDFLDLEDRARTFDGLAAYNNYAAATLTGEGDAERVAGTRVTARFFSILGVAPRMGRDFRRDDDVPGASPVVMLSDGFWRRRFGGDPSIVGRTIQLSSVAYEVVGVLPSGFEHPFPDEARQPDVYVTFRIDRKDNARSGHFLQAIGRLHAGVSLAAAEADLVAVAADLERTYPNSNTGRSVSIQPMLDSMVGSARPALLVLVGTVAFVLLIACANLANLLLARSTSRQKEIAVRQALGATRRQLVGQFLAESVVLAMAGGAVGLLFAQWITRTILALGAARIPRGDAIHLDPGVLAFTVALSLLTGLLFGVGPAVYATRVDRGGALKEGGRTGEGRMHRRAQHALIVSETALALVLLVGAGLLVKSLWRLASVDPGFRADHVLTLQTSLPTARYPEGDEIPFYQRLEERVRALPGVREVGAVNILPLGGNYSCDSFDIDGRRPFPPGHEPCAENRSITPGYFAAMGIPLLRGRTFTGRDVEGAGPVVIINERMASTLWPGKNPVGSRLVRGGVTREIIGVVGGVKHFGLDRDVTPEMYTPHAQQPSYHTMTLVVRASTDPASLMPSIRAVVSTMDRDVPISSVATMDQIVAVSTTEPRFRAMLVGAFAALALVLSVVGVAGVISYTVGRRMHEIGVRVALGATGRQVVGLLLAQGMWPAAMGIAIGLAGSLALTRVLSGLLYGVAATDVGTFAFAAAVLASASLAATYLPARRAMTVDPVIALRAE